MTVSTAAFSTLMEPDEIERLDATLDYVLSHPTEWDQHYWGHVPFATDQEIPQSVFEWERELVPECGTVFCFAGVCAVRILGAQPHWSRSITLERWEMSWVLLPDGSNHPVADLVRENLGLTRPQSNNLFMASNSMRRLVELCYLYSGSRVDRFEQYWTLPPEFLASDALADQRRGQFVANEVDHERDRPDPCFDVNRPSDWDHIDS